MIGHCCEDDSVKLNEACEYIQNDIFINYPINNVLPIIKKSSFIDVLWICLAVQQLGVCM